MFANTLASNPEHKTNKNFLLLFFICCLLPLVGAELALSFSWFSVHTINKGQWLEQELQLLPSTHSAERWSLVYVQNSECTRACELSLYAMQQIHSSLGHNKNKINTYLVSTHSPAQLQSFPTVKWYSPDYSLMAVQNHIYIVNQQGLAILRYPIIQDQKNLLAIGKDIRTDLLRLINYDRSSL